MKDKIKKEDYSLNFKAQGVDLLFVDLDMHFYSPRIAIQHSKNGEFHSYYSNESLEEMNRIGSHELFISQVEGRVDNFKKAYDELQGIDLESLDYNLLEKIFNIFGVLAHSFALFNNGYLDGFYSNNLHAKDSEFLTRLGKLKNELREEVNKVFFEKGGWYALVLQKVAEQVCVDYGDLIFYRIDELKTLHRESKSLGDDEIRKRKEAHVFIGTGEEVLLLTGDEAMDVIGLFEDTINPGNDQILRGVRANGGGAVGRVRVILTDYSDFIGMRKQMDEMQEGEILVSQLTAPELMSAIVKADALVTELGGMLSHAAITSRELNKPCIIGVAGVTKILKTGDLVEVDAEQGIVRIIK